MRAHLKRVFAGPQSPHKVLKVKDKTMPISQRVRDAVFQAAHPNPAKRSKASLEGLYRDEVTLNQREFVGILQFLMDTKLQHPNDRRHLMAFLEYVGKKAYHVEFNEEVLLMSNMYENALKTLPFHADLKVCIHRQGKFAD
eukprot:2188961-Amphidinium_carterae.1